MPIIMVKGEIDFMKWAEIRAWYDSRLLTLRYPDFDQFLIECAVRGFEEVKNNVQVHD